MIQIAVITVPKAPRSEEQNALPMETDDKTDAEGDPEPEPNAVMAEH